MADLLTLENLGNLIMLCFLQAVLGFDNLLYISIESQKSSCGAAKGRSLLGHYHRGCASSDLALLS